MSIADELVVRIQQLMETGMLPCVDCEVTWYGAGRGRRCAACDRRILSTDTEIECDVPGGGQIYFHQSCHKLWHSVLPV